MDFNFKPLKGSEKLASKWSNTADLSGSNPPVRLEGEIGDMVIRGTIPGQVNGTFYRVAQDPFTPPHSKQAPIDGHGVITAFRINDGRVDFKVKYVETERYLVERRAGKTLFGLNKNPWSDHPCVRGVIDSTAQTNIIYWNNSLLALRESANPYSLDPDTLETKEYDPYADQVDSRAFTAHPKIDPFTDELVVFGYEAKGPGTDDVVTYSIDRNGKVHNETWVKSPFVTLIHDMALTENFIILLLWPFEASVERMKAGGQHFVYNYDLPASFIVIPRRPDQTVAGWQPSEYRVYNYRNCMHGHTGSGWEENGKIYVETTRAHDNAFAFWPAADGRVPKGPVEVDFVRYEIDPTQPTGSSLPEPEVLVDFANEFPRIDDRYMSKKYNIVFMNVFYPGHNDSSKHIYSGLNAVAMLDTRTKEKKIYWPGENCYCQEPVFVPRHADAAEGDGWIMFVVERRDINTSHLVFLDTAEDFTTPVAVADLPLRLRPQIHGNWIDASELNDKTLVREPTTVKLSGKGWQILPDGTATTKGTPGVYPRPTANGSNEFDVTENLKGQNGHGH